jgi:nucleoid-associated protein YgaU
MSTTAYIPRHRSPPARRAVILAGLSLAVSIVAVIVSVIALVITLMPSATSTIPAHAAPVPTASASAPTHTTQTPPARQQPAPPVLRHYVVRAGDSLWLVSLHAYGTGMGWGKIYTANRAVIGSNPNHIVAGTVLTIPRN